MSKCTYIDGIGTSQAIDTSGEVVDLKGIDISSLVGSAFNWEHTSNMPASIVGKILEAVKIFSKEDCLSERHLYYWNKCQTPFLYVMGRLFDDKKPSAVEVAALFQDDAEHPHEHPMLGFSVEGARLGEKKGMIVPRSIARKITITNIPANKSCVAEILPQKKDPVEGSLDSIFKGELTLFKFESSYEDILEKKEDLEKSLKGVTFHHESKLPKNVKVGKEHRPSGEVGEHGENHRLNMTNNHYFAVHNNKVIGHLGIKEDSDEYHKPVINASYVNPEHRGKGVGSGLYGHALSHEPSLASDNAREPGANAIWGKLQQKHPKNITHDKKADRFVWQKSEDLKKDAGMSLGASVGGTESGGGGGGGAFVGSQLAMTEEKSKKLKKAMTAGSGMVAPSQLEGGAALVVESLDKKPKKLSSMQKNEWNKVDGSHKMSHSSGHKFEIHDQQNGSGYKLQHTSPKGEMTTYSPFQNPEHAKSHANGLLGKSESLQKKEKSHWYERAEQAYDTWDKKNHFKQYMQKRMPHLAEGEIDAIGRVLALKKSINAEGKLSKMYASYFGKSKKMEKTSDVMMASEKDKK